MKTIKLLFAMLFAFATFQIANAQSDKTQRTIGVKTQTVKVSGTCDMDKRRIENTALTVEGIKYAVWSLDAQTLTVKYSVFKKEAADIAEKKIAAAGNDTEHYKADDTAYKNLPECCHYQRKQS
ncbi:heavy-metal-associated domain-containing protein [Panacibacter ginsenosidivorans]|uniref:Heavy-metal-associated domain-containing protein n=1 Tax=Panacibacter ginsenosidivorans TaxID=1813871 RepID=A0A5B8VD58_9BACT|nr:heavy metal-associated domain-containing protein [Panacibacter ginsenosidivorans]QEC69252.1 heavy-metal-associated domain-containing protein [Panacibacter ginsenosidivorans]